MPKHNSNPESGSRLGSIVLAMDFSEHALRALDWAAALAQAHSAALTIVHCIDPSVHGVAAADSESKAQQDLANLAASVRTRNLSVQTEYHIGKPWQVINDAARAAHADLIVLGTHGRGNLSRLLGGTADRVIRTAATPVLTIRPQSHGGPENIRTVMLPTDFSDESALATAAATRLLAKAEAPVRLVLLHVIALTIDYPTPSMPVTVPDYWEDAQREATTRLETMAAAVRSKQFDVIPKVVRGIPSVAIIEQAQGFKADLIALGTVGRSGLKRFFIGSVAERVLHHSTCPVLTVRRSGIDDDDHH